jgi:hypothetical protein
VHLPVPGVPDSPACGRGLVLLEFTSGRQIRLLTPRWPYRRNLQELDTERVKRPDYLVIAASVCMKVIGVVQTFVLVENSRILIHENRHLVCKRMGVVMMNYAGRRLR